MTAVTEEPERISRRRSVATVEQRMAVAAVVSVVAAGGAFMSPEPTGWWFVDALYRAAWVASLGLAGSRARRWSLVIGSTVCAIASLGIFLLAAVVALFLSVALVGRNQRNRVYGAAVGSLVGFSALGLAVGGPSGLETAIAFAVGAIIAWSGYSNTSRVVRKRWRRGALALMGLWILGGVCGGALALFSRAPLESAVAGTTEGVAAIRDGDSAVATARLSAAGADFRSASDRAEAPWFLPARLVPVVAQNAEVIRVVSAEGESLASSAARTLADVDYSQLTRPEGGIDLVRLDQFVDPVADGSRRIRAAREAVEGMDSPWVVGPLQSRLSDFRAELDSIYDDAVLADLALSRAPSLLGADRPKNYLVLLANPAEARDLGGHIGNWAHVRFDDGTLELVDVGRPLELSNLDADLELAQLGDVPASFLAMQPGRYPQNWGSTPDFDVAASVAGRLFERQVGIPIDGVVYADPFVLAAMLDITGPVPLPLLEGQSIDSSTAVEFLTAGQYTAYPDETAADDGVTQLVDDLFSTFVETRLPSPEKLGSAFGPLTRERRLRFASTNVDDRALLERMGLSVRLPTGENHDLLSIVTRNANPSKIDAFLHRETSYVVDWDPSTGRVAAKIEVVLRNDAPVDGLPEIIIGGAAGRPLGTNVTTLGVITPFELEAATVDGESFPVSPVWEGAWWRHTVRVEVPAGGSVTIAMEVAGDIDPGDRYVLATIGQAIMDPGPLEVVVKTTSGDFVPGPKVVVQPRTAAVSLDLLGDSQVSLDLE